MLIIKFNEPFWCPAPTAHKAAKLMTNCDGSVMYLINTVLQVPKNIQQVQLSKQSITAAMEIFLSISIAEHRQQILPDANIWLQVFLF